MGVGELDYPQRSAYAYWCQVGWLAAGWLASDAPEPGPHRDARYQHEA